MVLHGGIPDFKGWNLEIHGTSDDADDPNAFMWIEIRHKKLGGLVLKSEQHLNDIGPRCVVNALTDVIRKGGRRLPASYRQSFIDFMTGYMTAVLESAAKDGSH